MKRLSSPSPETRRVFIITTLHTASRVPSLQRTRGGCVGLLQLLLGAEVGSVTAGLLAAVGGPGVQAGVALAADHLK